MTGKSRIFRAALFSAGAAAFIAAISNGSASAKTKAQCRKDYTAQKASGATAAQSQAQFIKACLAVDSAKPVEGTDDAGGETKTQSASDLAKKLQNPIGDLYSFPFQSNTNFGYGPHGGTQEILNIQPVIPIHVNDQWNVITRTVIPVVWNPELTPIPTVPQGIGPTTFSAFLSPRNPIDGWVWGVGPAVQIPTVTSTTIGSNVWGAGPTAVLVYLHGPWVVGALANNVWSFGGTGGPLGTSYNNFLVQPFVNYNFGEGWYVSSSPIVTANWQAEGTKWTVPVGGGVGRVVRLGKLPVNISVSAYDNVVKPEYGADWQLRTQVTLIF